MATTQAPAAVVEQILPSPEPSGIDEAEDPILWEAPSPVIVPVTSAAPSEQETTIPPAAPPQTTAPVGPAAGECTPANIDIKRDDTVRAIKPIPSNEEQYYTVLGCAEGWLAYSISDEGIKAIGLDGGNAWYNIATLQSNGRYLTDFTQLYSDVYNWEFQTFAVQNGQYATAQEAMDHEFATKGIPVRLREQLVGTGPAAPAPSDPGACTPANIDIQRHDQIRAIAPIPAEQQQYYTVLGCAEGWLAYAISDEGIRAARLDGGNVYYSLARLQSNGRYLSDFAQPWTSVHSWEFLAFDVPDGRYATVQEAMDHQFATNGIPVRLREQLVGPGPAAPAPTAAP
ncbi:hypothetical protein [Paenarthrobacter sp. NPDC089316]|uniref:hypothetical protein n=1 Tax=unclassified Paenarthrobacter TaxID=2634190 RepID=UPI00344338F9